MPFAEQGGNPEVTKPSAFIERSIRQMYEDITDGADVTLTMLEIVKQHPEIVVDTQGVTDQQLNQAWVRARKIEAGELTPVTRKDLINKWAAQHNAKKDDLVYTTQIATGFNDGNQD